MVSWTSLLTTEHAFVALLLRFDRAEAGSEGPAHQLSYRHAVPTNPNGVAASTKGLPPLYIYAIIPPE